MDHRQFDRLAAALTQAPTRRSILRRLGLAAAAPLGIAVLGIADDAAHGKKRRKNKKKRCLRSGALCAADKQCCGGGLICEVPQNASNSDTRCCGGQGATCGGVNEEGDFLEPFCCVGEAGERSFVCSANDPNNPRVRGACIPNPKE